MTEKRILEILKESGVLQQGHFLLTSGKHSDRYMQCAKLFKNAAYSEELCAVLANKYEEYNIDIVIGPALGAVLMSYEVSRHLKVENIFTERDENGKMCLRRGFEIKPGQNVLIVEDVVTTGGSVKEVIEIVKECGACVAGIGAIVDRTNGKIDFGVDFKAVISVDISSWDKDECPLCKDPSVPEAFKPGSRKK